MAVHAPCRRCQPPQRLHGYQRHTPLPILAMSAQPIPRPPPSARIKPPSSISSFSIKHASPSEFWAAADVHCRVFHEEKRLVKPLSLTRALKVAGMHIPEELAAMQPFLDRVDRVACLQTLEAQAGKGAGHGVLLLAYQQPEASRAPSSTSSVSPTQQQLRPGSPPAAASSSSHAAPGLSAAAPDSDTVLIKSLVQQIQGNVALSMMLGVLMGGHPGHGVGIGAEEARLLGVCYVDSFGDLVPAKANQHSGAWRRRSGIAYVSNVAVLPSARGRGVARRMVQEAEALAQSWGCRAVGLHCNQKNTPAVQLYRSMGYRKTVLEPAIMPYLHGRAPDRCHFMLRRLPQGPAHTST